MKPSQMKLALFLALTFGLSALFYIPIINTGTLGDGVIGLMWMPGLSALIAQLVVTRSLKGLGWRLGAWKYLLLGLLIPIAYSLVIYGLTWLVGLGDYDASAPLLAVVLSAVLGFPISILLALGEEVGWRGLLVPTLFQRMSFSRTAIISGFIWAVWHYPIILFADYNAGTPVWFGLICFTISVVCVGVISAWLRIASGSVWGSVLLHASHNTVIQSVFDILTLDTGTTHYFTTEFGFGLVATSLVLAIFFWRQGQKLNSHAAATKRVF